MAGQHLLVRKDDHSINLLKTFNGKRPVGHRTTSTRHSLARSSPRSAAYGAAWLWECATALFSGIVDAVTTDDIFAGLASARAASCASSASRSRRNTYGGVGIKKGDTALAKKINAAITEMIRTVPGRAIADNTEGVVHAERGVQPAETDRGGEVAWTDSSNCSASTTFLPFLVNIELTLWSALFSLILGVVGHDAHLADILAAHRRRSLRGTVQEPAADHHHGVHGAGRLRAQLTFSDTFVTNFFWLAVTGAGLYTAAFVCESLRSGINTVPIGQAEAARALGLGFHAVGHADHPAAGVPRLGRASRQCADRVAEELHGGRTMSVATETSSLMSTMIEFHPDDRADLPDLRVRLCDSHHPRSAC